MSRGALRWRVPKDPRTIRGLEMSGFVESSNAGVGTLAPACKSGAPLDVAPHGGTRIPEANPDVRGITRRNLVYLLPLGVFGGLAATFAVSLRRDATKLPSALIGRPVPEFDLPPVQGRTLGLSSANLKGDVSLVNVFASWCAPCRQEHPLFLDLRKRAAIATYGINYKDRPEDASSWLNELGDPYTRTGADRDGRVAIDWGVYGVPETFVVDRAGVIAHRHVGPLTGEALNRTILPLVERLRG